MWPRTCLNLNTNINTPSHSVVCESSFSSVVCRFCQFEMCSRIEQNVIFSNALNKANEKCLVRVCFEQNTSLSEGRQGRRLSRRATFHRRSVDKSRQVVPEDCRLGNWYGEQRICVENFTWVSQHTNSRNRWNLCKHSAGHNLFNISYHETWIFRYDSETERQWMRSKTPRMKNSKSKQIQGVKYWVPKDGAANRNC